MERIPRGIIVAGVTVFVLSIWMVGLILLINGVIPIKFWMVGINAVISMIYIFNLGGGQNVNLGDGAREHT